MPAKHLIISTSILALFTTALPGEAQAAKACNPHLPQNRLITCLNNLLGDSLERLDVAEDDLAAAEGEIATLQDDLTAAQGEIASLQTDLDSHWMYILELQDADQQLEAFLAEHDQNIAALEMIASEHDQRITVLDEEVAALAGGGTLADLADYVTVDTATDSVMFVGANV